MTAAGGWFHCSVKPVSRSAGRSAVAAAAYRAGQRLYDERTRQTHDYTRRSGVEGAFVIAPTDAPEWAQDWGKLWNAAEAAEKRSNSQTAREIELALPASVSLAERENIAREFAAHLVERYGVTVAVALHEPGKEGDERNHHAHILMTTRRMDGEGLGAKTRELDDKKTGGQEVRHIREYAAAVINTALERAGLDERVDHRSFKDRGIERVPSEHLGVEAAAMERRGKKSGRGDRNREITERNQCIDELIENRSKANEMLDKLEAYKEMQSAVNAPLVQAHKRQILRDGEITHTGLLSSWFEHSRQLCEEVAHEIAYLTKRSAGNVWNDLKHLIHRNQEPEQER